jgi:superfamily I DNA/RNA helicase
MNILEQLNAEQQHAVTASDGPVIIVAGPGTGKTKTLTTRIAYLMQERQVPAKAILALTFTNKAAREMQERVSTLLETGRAPLVSTFHALATKLLPVQDGSRLVSESERTELLRNLKKQHPVPHATLRDVSLLVSRAKNQLHPVDDAAAVALVQAYNAALADRHLYDYDDLLLRLHAFLRQPDRQLPYRHILVDEFQDTNGLQYELLKLLNTTNNLFVIGDPLQSIYGFRGADAGVFDRFRKDWPTAAEVSLTINYRSVPAVVCLAGALFPDVPPLHAHRQDAGRVCAMEVLNEYSEADWVINEIERQVGGSDMLRSSQHHTQDQQRTFRDFAVLYRTHAAARTVQRALEASGIPYQVAGEGSPYALPHIVAITEALAYLAGTGDVPAIKGYKSTQVAALLAPLKLEETDSLPVLVQHIAELLGLATDQRTVSLRQFMNSLVPFEHASIAEYLEHLHSIAEQEYYDPAADAITLLTIHAAKGLEFSRVFLAAAEEGLIPHVRPGTQEVNLEEERRLCYVAATRARDELYLLHAQRRSGEAARLSRFITALPSGIVEYAADSSLLKQKRTLERRRQKRSQASLF